MTGTAVIVGASGGIGRALLDAVASAGSFSAVHALSRSPPAVPSGATAHRVDITDEATIARAAAAIGGSAPVTLILVASGLLHDADLTPEKSVKALDPGGLARLFAVNAIGPALVAKHFVHLMPRRGRSIFAALSARVGSIEDNRLGGWYGYRASKAALNQMMRTLAVEVARSRPDAVVLALHPGTVATGLSQPFRGVQSGPGIFTPEQSAGHLLRVVAAATPAQSGSLLAWDGSAIPF